MAKLTRFLASQTIKLPFAFGKFELDTKNLNEELKQEEFFQDPSIDKLAQVLPCEEKEQNITQENMDDKQI